MKIEIGHVEALYRYPVKSMRGELLESAVLDWQGVAGDRRLALRLLEYRTGGFPWLTAGKFPEMVLFTPERTDSNAPDDLPSHVRTPGGKSLPLFGEELAADVGGRLGAPVQMMHLRNGIFDDGSVSVIASATVDEIGGLVGLPGDPRRFRPNILVRLLKPAAFQEDEWVGGVLSFGEGDSAPAIAVTTRDLRCGMVNIDPDSAALTTEVMKAVVRANQNNAGVYGAVTRTGRLEVGQTIFFQTRGSSSGST